MEKHHVLVAGGQNFSDPERLEKTLDQIVESKVKQGREVTVVTAGRDGAEKLAERYADTKGFEFKKIEITPNLTPDQIDNKLVTAVAKENSKDVVVFRDAQNKKDTEHIMKTAQNQGIVPKQVMYQSPDAAKNVENTVTPQELGKNSSSLKELGKQISELGGEKSKLEKEILSPKQIEQQVSRTYAKENFPDQMKRIEAYQKEARQYQQDLKQHQDRELKPEEKQSYNQEEKKLNDYRQRLVAKEKELGKDFDKIKTHMETPEAKAKIDKISQGIMKEQGPKLEQLNEMNKSMDTLTKNYQEGMKVEQQRQMQQQAQKAQEMAMQQQGRALVPGGR